MSQGNFNASGDESRRSAAHSVRGSEKVGKPAANRAKGMAMGGPWGAPGAAIGSCWKGLRAAFLIFLLIAVAAVQSLPGLISHAVFGMEETEAYEDITPEDVFGELSVAISQVLARGYQDALDEVDRIIAARVAEGDYDEQACRDAVVDLAADTLVWDTATLLAAWSCLVQADQADAQEFLQALEQQTALLFTVEVEDPRDAGHQVLEELIPVTWTAYEPEQVWTVESVSWYDENGDNAYLAPEQYTGSREDIVLYCLRKETKYRQGEEQSSSEPVTVPVYSPVTLQLPVYSVSRDQAEQVLSGRTFFYSPVFSGSRSNIVSGWTADSGWYEPTGEEQTLEPEARYAYYCVCTISAFDQDALIAGLGIDPDAPYLVPGEDGEEDDYAELVYGEGPMTCGEYIQVLAQSLKSILADESSDEAYMQEFAYAGSGTWQADPDSLGYGDTGFLWPLAGYFTLTSLQGARLDPFTNQPAHHNGIDISAPEGTPLLSALDGTVVVSQYSGSYGNHVVVRHSVDLEDGTQKTYYTLYAHMSRRSVSVGQTVAQGQVLGEVGSTGRSTGNHLHYEIRYDQNDLAHQLDPIPFYPNLELYYRSGGQTVLLEH